MLRWTSPRRSFFMGAALFMVASAAPANNHDSGAGRESLRLRVVNAVGGAIEVSADRGRTWLRLGNVLQPANTVSAAGYTAASWALPSAVAATSVNAIHLKITQSRQNNRATIFSLVPRGPLVGAANRAPSSAVVTDLEGGTAIFGGGLGPYVNSPVSLERDSTLATLPEDYVPAGGDILVIRRLEPVRLPLYAILENQVGGGVYLDYGEGAERVGRVDHPVRGIGRFEGTRYAAPGRIRANHPGVIDISTSPLAMIGGFQIIPRRHAQSPEMLGSSSAQWLVIGPDDPAAVDWAGLPPFFADTILPSYREDDITGGHTDWLVRVLSRCQVQVRYLEEPWGLMPRIAFTTRGQVDTGSRSEHGRHGLWLIPAQANPRLPMSAEEKRVADQALDGISAIRIVFPRAPFPALAQD